MMIATTEAGDNRRFATARDFARWRLAGNGGALVRVVDISVVKPTPEQKPAPDGNRGPVDQQRQ